MRLFRVTPKSPSLPGLWVLAANMAKAFELAELSLAMDGDSYDPSNPVERIEEMHGRIVYRAAAGVME